MSGNWGWLGNILLLLLVSRDTSNQEDMTYFAIDMAEDVV